MQLERRDVVASQTLRAALTKAEQAHPGLSYDIVMGILKKGDLNVNLNESILRLQGNATETDCTYYSSHIFDNHNHMVTQPLQSFCVFPMFFSGWVSFEPFRRCLSRVEQKVGLAETDLEPNSRRNQRSQNIFGDNQVCQILLLLLSYASQFIRWKWILNIDWAFDNAFLFLFLLDFAER